MPENEQELLKLETEVYHSDGGIYFAECDSASTRDEMAQQLENRFINKNVKVIKINVRMAGVASTRDEIARRLEEISSSKKAGEIFELEVQANNLPYAVTQYPGDNAAFFVYLPSEKSELEDLARILNYTRAEFAEVKQPIIIWADKVSLGVIAQSAPDFWAWRARVSEFRSVSDDLGYGGEVEAVETIWRGKISDEEIQAYERALEEFKDRGDEKEAAKTLRQLGLLHYRRGEWDLAIEYYEKSMEISEALGDRHGLAQTYNNLGAVYARKGEWDLAIEYYEKDMEISEALGDRHGLAQTYNNLGAVYADKGEWDLAIEYYEKDMEISEALGDRHGLAQTYNNLGAVYADKGEWDLAIEYYEKDMEIFEALGDRHGLAQTYNNLGLVYARKGDWDLAIEYYEKDMEIFEALGDRHGLAQTYNNLGAVYADKGEWDLAIEYYEKDMEISEALGDRHGLAQTYNNLGAVYADKGEWDLAIEYYEKSMKIKEALGDRHGLAQTYNNLGAVYADKGEWDLAIEYYEKSMKIKEALGDRHGLAQTYNNLGAVYADKGEWDLAIEYYEKDMEISEALGDRHGLAQTYNNLGLVYADKGDWDLAIEYYEKDMEISEALGDRHGLAQTYGNLGAVYARKGDWDLAIEYYEKDMEIFEALGDRHGLAQTYNNLGLVYARKGDWDLAIEYYEKDMEISEALGDRHGFAQTYGNLGLVYADKGEWDLAIEYYEKDMEISEALGDRHGVGITLSNIGKLYLDRSDPMGAKENLEEAIKKIHPDARPHYPNTLNWLAVSLRMIAEQKKREAKLASSDVEREKLVTAAAKLYREAAEKYKETYDLPLARMPCSLMMNAHLARGLAFSVQNITEEDSKKAIALLDRAIAGIEAALKFADGTDKIRLEGEIASHKAKRCVREIGLHREDAKHPYPFGAFTITKKIIMHFRKKKRDRLLDEAISHLAGAAGSFDSLGDAGACNRKTCDGCRHLYKAIGLIRDGYREQTNQKIMDAVSEIRSAEKCYQSISNELGTGVADQVNKILRRVADNLKNTGKFDPGGVIDAANDVFDALDEISGVGLRNMIKILVFDEAGNVTEREIPTMGSSGGDSARDGGVILSGDIGDNATISIETGDKPSTDKRKSVSLWDYVLGALGGILTSVIAAISMSLYFEEPINNFRTPAIIIFVIMLLIIIYMRYKLSKSKI